MIAHNTQNEKFCPGCGIKSLNDFYKDCSRKDGLCQYCKDCKSLRKKNWYKFGHYTADNISIASEVRFCQTCGKVFPPSGTRRLHCKDCFHRNRKTRKRKGKQSFREYRDDLKSGGCVICNYNKCLSALEFHHVNDNKEVMISEINSKAKLDREIKNGLVILCANCHREVHVGLIGNEMLKVMVLRKSQEQSKNFKSSLTSN